MSAFPPHDTGGMPTVACIGLSALDYIWSVPKLEDQGKMRADNFATKGGGMAATAAVTVARLGGHAHFWGRAGADPEGRFMRDALAAEDVDVSAFQLFENGRSSISSVWVDQSGERRIVNFRGAGLPPEPQWLPLAEIRRFGAVLSDPRWPEGTEAAFAAARAAGIPTVLDADMADAEVFELLLPLTDHAIFSEPALKAFAGDKDPLASVVAHGCRLAAVTRGSGGVDWIEAGERHHADAFPVAVIDTTGAGDVFHGAYSFAIGAQATSQQAMSFAAAAAALKCTRPDGRSGIPNLQDTIQLWRSRL